MLPIIVDGTPDFAATVRKLCTRGSDDLESVAPVVREILADVRRGGDQAVLRYVDAFERRKPEQLVRHDYAGAAALAHLDPHTKVALERAAARIQSYHERQLASGFEYDEAGITLGMRVSPLERVGVYAPGGKARYPSSVLMTAIPARVAGVREIVLATPAPDDAVLAAAHLAGVAAVLDAGGAHAIAAMAYGTESLARVDKIVGPGNAYVACAKRLVFGDVAIEGIAGPSESVVLADGSADARLAAAELLAQAEHDEMAVAVLITTSRAVAEGVARELDAQLATLPRKAVCQAALERRGALLVVD